MTSLPPGGATIQLEPLRALLRLARLGAQFRPSDGLLAWLDFLTRPTKRGPPPPVPFDSRSGFPSPGSLEALARLRSVSKAYFESHGVAPEADSPQLHTALAASPVPMPVAFAATLVEQRPKGSVVVQLTHDGFDALACPTRDTWRLVLPKGRWVKLEKTGACTLDVEAVEVLRPLQRLPLADTLRGVQSTPGLEVLELARGVVGPYAGALVPLEAAADSLAQRLDFARAAAGDQAAALALRVERTGPGVPNGTAAEHRVVCTPDLETPLREALAEHRLLIRSR